MVELRPRLSSLRERVGLRSRLSNLRMRVSLKSRLLGLLSSIDVRPHLSQLDLHSWGKITFWSIFSIPVLFCSIIAIPMFDVGLNVLLPKNSSIFSTSILALVNLIGFLFIILIFVFQNVTQEHNPDLSKEIYKDKYLISIFGLLLLITVINFSGLYVQSGSLLQSVGFVLTACSFFYLVPLSLITGYYLNISNIIKKSEQRIKATITDENIYNRSGFLGVPLKNEDFQQELSQDTLLITNTSIQAIENNNHVLVVTCVESLEQIGHTYLNQLESPVDDDFVRELNDQYEFIIQRTGNDYTSQKYLTPLCESIGSLSRSTFINTENTTQTSLWLESLKEIFEIAYPEMDRTEAVGISIKEINRTVILALETETQVGTSHYWQYFSYLEEIGRWSLRSGASLPLQTCISQFKWHYFSMLSSLMSGRLYYETHEFEKPLDEMKNLYSSAWESDRFDNRLIESVFFNPVNSLPKLFRYYGLYSLSPDQAAANGGVTASPPEEFTSEPRSEITFGNARIESEFLDKCELLVEFTDDIASNCLGTNYNGAYSAYPELLLIFSIDIKTEFVEKDDLINTLTSDFHTHLINEVNNTRNSKPSTQTREHFADFLLLTIYIYKQDDERLCELLGTVIQFYQKSKVNAGKKESRWIYKHLKLAGAIINQCDGLENSQQQIDEVLLTDFYEIPEYPGKVLRPHHEQMGYPTGRGHGIRKLSANKLWGFHKKVIEEAFYGENMESFASYHYNLKIKAAIQRAMAVKSAI